MDFWDGALIGVVSDRVGGRRAAIIIPFIWGIVSQFGFMLMVPLLGGPLGEMTLLNDYPDVGWLTPLWWLTRSAGNALGQWGMAGLWILSLVVIVIVANVIGRRRKAEQAPSS